MLASSRQIGTFCIFTGNDLRSARSSTKIQSVPLCLLSIPVGQRNFGEKNDLSSEEPKLFNDVLAAMNRRPQKVDAQLLSENLGCVPTPEP